MAKKVVNLSSEERRKYGSISKQNKLFVNKINDYAVGQANLRSPDVDWAEFNKDFHSRAIMKDVIAVQSPVLEAIHSRSNQRGFKK